MNIQFVMGFRPVSFSYGSCGASKKGDLCVQCTFAFETIYFLDQKKKKKPSNLSPQEERGMPCLRYIFLVFTRFFVLRFFRK